MAKKLFIAEKPSVAQEFAKALKYQMSRRDGYLESEEAIVTWCVGHLVTMSYPEVYDIKYKKWSVDTLPFIPETFKYEVISSVKKQFDIVSSLLNRPDVDTIYVCTDSGREGEYIYRLVEQEANIHGKKRRRVWIDSQTEEEILRGVREAKDLSEYDNLANAAYLRAKEDYLMGINYFPCVDFKIRQPCQKLLAPRPCGDFSWPCNDLCIGHGRQPGTRNPFVCKNAFLPCDGSLWDSDGRRKGKAVRGRMARSRGKCLEPFAAFI